MAQYTTSQIFGSSVALGTNWGSTGNMYASDNNRATYSNSGQNPIIVKGFNFSAIPDNATIIGLRILVEGQGSNVTASNRSIQVGITKDGAAIYGSYTSTQNFSWLSDGTLTFGSQTSLSAFGSGLSISVAEAKAASFGMIMRAGNTSTGQRSIDGVKLEITYTVPDAVNVNDARSAKITGSDSSNSARSSKIYGGFENTVYDSLDSTTNKDALNTTAKWSGDGEITLQ